MYGGASPKTGFDCSGFTYYVYKHFRYTLSRSSKAQANNGKKVEKEDLQPGDLLIFKNQSLTAIGHVGIYIGNKNSKKLHKTECIYAKNMKDENAEVFDSYDRAKIMGYVECSKCFKE